MDFVKVHNEIVANLQKARRHVDELKSLAEKIKGGNVSRDDWPSTKKSVREAEICLAHVREDIRKLEGDINWLIQEKSL